MSFSMRLSEQAEVAGSVAVNLEWARRPQYGRYLDEFVPGQVFVHPRGFTFDRAAMLDFARVFMQCNPLYLNLEYAKAHGFPDLPASPQMVFNVVLSLGVHNDSEKAIANLGYYNVQFLRPVYSGDTLRGYTQVVDRKARGEDKPGIVLIRTLGVNQHNQVVLQYERKIMVDWRGDRLPTTPAPTTPVEFPWVEHPVVDLPINAGNYPSQLTGPNTYFEDFALGDLIVHANGRTITDEHMALTYLVGNTHPLHFDRVYSTGLSGKMSGEPIVYGGLVFAWLEGLASRDVSENALWELGFTEGYHTQPAVSGDTVAAMSRVIATEVLPNTDAAGIVTFQFIGVKNISAAAALETYGADLFIKENDKQKLSKEKLSSKIFEIERRLLIKRHPA
ncbi:MaoC family dehydratase [Candidatus Contendibacter odensensis]|uniref:Acyl dehydratase n=1 Tax=Candidatus Contendobacter odensis Run_B_J11 TaxID=1400861 RepID=A0A7U7GCS6_9GAMM|nr:MaoC family dehydratase [Candidatus Competibacteraceae bacterium]CDH45703.1 putative acyl dehydratase [Candidatus Contendobacter odensis Run_B_J11]